MVSNNAVAEIGALIGDPARATILSALQDGRALTAGELAQIAGITPQTASGHLAKLSAAGLLAMEKQGRHRYHRLASRDVAQLLESLEQLIVTTATPTAKKLVTGPRDAALRHARTCYDHFAGKLGVAITDALLARDWVGFEEEGGIITPRGLSELDRLGLPLPASPRKGARPLCRPCLDWSERRPHVAGTLGAAICTHFTEQGYVRRRPKSRAVEITRAGEKALREMFGVCDLGIGPTVS